MDYAHAHNYWRTVVVSQSKGAITREQFDEWFPETWGKGPFHDAVLGAFNTMLAAAVQGKFGQAPGSD